MQRLVEFSQHHPLLIGLFVAVLIAIAVDEALRRLRDWRELSPASGVLFMNKGAAVVDLRSAAEYAAGHIINSRNIPLPELDGRLTELEKFRGQPVLLYCKSGDDSHTAAKRLGKLGFSELAVLKGGLSGWEQEHFPLEKR